MHKLVLVGLVMLLIVSLSQRNPNSAMASEVENTEKPQFMEQCEEFYQKFECLVLWKYGNYPSKPFIDMTGSPMEQIIAATAEPIKPPRARPER